MNMRAILAVTVLIFTASPAPAAGPESGCPDGYIEDMSQSACVPEQPEFAAGADWTWRAVGYARVIDGDTIELQRPELASCPPPGACPEDASEQVRHVKIRLYGIDAPEVDQICHGPDGAPWACGAGATEYLEGLIAMDKVMCFGGGRHMQELGPYGRRIAICHIRARSNLNGDMVRFGYALADRRYSDSYIPDEATAKLKKAGMKSGSFMAPWEWRRRKTLEGLRRRIDRAMKETQRDRI